MAADTFKLFDEFLKYLGDGTIDLDTHTFKVMLTNTAPVQGTSTVKADIIEIAAGNGYTAGGATLASVTWTETGAGTGVWRFTAADYVFTAAGGSIGPFRYMVIYDDTPITPADPLVGFNDFGSSITIPDTGTFTGDIGASGLFEVDATP